MRRDREAKSQSRKADKYKGVPDLLVTNLTYLLRLVQVFEHEAIPPHMEGACGIPEASAPDNAAEEGQQNRSLTKHLRAHILLNQWDDLSMGIHQFGMVQHTSTSQKVLKDRSDQHQVIAGGDAAPFLADSDTLTVPDGLSLPSTLSMEWGSHMWLSMVLDTLLGWYQPTMQAMREINEVLLERETNK